MQARRTVRRHALASKTLIAGFALACALAGSPASAQQPFNTVIPRFFCGRTKLQFEHCVVAFPAIGVTSTIKRLVNNQIRPDGQTVIFHNVGLAMGYSGRCRFR